MSSASAIDPMRTQRRRAGDTEQAEDEQRKIGPVGEGACDTGKRREIGEGAKLCICWRRSKLLRSARDYWAEVEAGGEAVGADGSAGGRSGSVMGVWVVRGGVREKKRSELERRNGVLDMAQLEPGPICHSVLTQQKPHRSTNVWKESHRMNGPLSCCRYDNSFWDSKLQ
nr:serine/threonine-protein phosphatase 7 long form homolog [Ipomoea batatas]